MCRRLWALGYLPGPRRTIGSQSRGCVRGHLRSVGECGGGTNVGGLASPLFAPLQLLTYVSTGERS